MTSITVAIKKIAKLVEGIDPDKIDELHKHLDIQVDEFVAYQELKSLATMYGKLSQEEAVEIYVYLGCSPEHFNKQPIEVKIALTKLFAELLSWKIGLTTFQA